ncbi:hypothetical protein WJX73_010142 [Symbiochloris irregularis]|uniref:PPPDE domain-containing protein n=1 Tax=Symbiochloris irregularis TaxID=706552 RepID=A0AAW1PEA1_9CHLO
MSDEKGEAVKLYVYDLSNGLARQLSQSLLGKQIDGVWHSAIVVNGREFYFGGGIQEVAESHSPFGRPQQVIDIGETFVPDEIRREFIADLRSKYSEATYDLFNNNCNNFADDLAQLLVGKGIPAHITSLPQEVLATPFGRMLAPMLSRTIASQGRQGGPRLAPEGARELSSAHRSLSSRPEAAAHLAKADQPPLSNPSVSAHAASAPSGKAASPSADRPAFEAALKAEFTRIMAVGNVSPNEAAAQAMRTVAGQHQAS